MDQDILKDAREWWACVKKWWKDLRTKGRGMLEKDKVIIVLRNKGG